MGVGEVVLSAFNSLCCVYMWSKPNILSQCNAIFCKVHQKLELTLINHGKPDFKHDLGLSHALVKVYHYRNRHLLSKVSQPFDIVICDHHNWNRQFFQLVLGVRPHSRMPENITCDHKCLHSEFLRYISKLHYLTMACLDN